MRYHYEKPELSAPQFGKLYICDHPVYTRCTLYEIDDYGLAVIQQRFNKTIKHTYWTEIDSWIANDLYLHPKFLDYFNKYAKTCTDDLYPTVTVRQIMWALKMKPIKRQPWETTFDHCPI